MHDNRRVARATELLVGRESAVAAVRSAAESAARHRGRLVLVTGEPGIGKTALLAEAGDAAAGTGALVVWGQCWLGDGAPAYWPWAQVLRAGIAAGADPGRAVTLLPGETPVEATPVPGGEAERFRLFDAVVSFLAGLAEQQPLVVVLDDLQWADEGSLRLLEFAARHLAAEAVLILGACREEEAGPLLRRLAATSEQIRLSGLGQPHVATLMAGLTGDRPPESVADDVWRRTGGNPFLIRELTRLLVAQGSYSGRMAPARELLASVEDILERRLARLSQRCVDLLTVAAVVGAEARLDVLLRVADDADEVPGLLAEAVAARILRQPETPAGPYRFSHDLFRETILAGLPADQRSRLHLTVGRVLESLAQEGASVHPAELAAHFGAAVTAAPAQAVCYGLRAAEDAASRLAFEEARGHYERVLAALQLTTEVEIDRLEVLLRLGAARNRAGDAEAARSAYREAADLARGRADAPRLASAALGLHVVGWRTVHAEAIDRLEEALRALPDAPSALRARALAALARELHHSVHEQDWERAPALAAEAAAIARGVDDPGTHAFALLALHDARWRPGSARERLVVLDEMLAASDAAQDADMLAQTRLLRATALLELGEAEGLAELEAYCRQSEALRHARGRYGALSRRATLALVAGDLTTACTLAEEALALGETIGEPDARGVYETLLWAARFAGGERLAETADREATLESQPWPGVPLLAAVVSLAAGDAEAARRALDRLRLDDLPLRHDLELLAFAAHTVAAAGGDEQRRRLQAMLLPHAGHHIVAGGCASYYGAVDHYLGLLARALGQVDEACAHFTSAAALHDRLGARLMAQESRGQADACRSLVVEQSGVLRREGDVWTVGYGGARSHLPDSKGLRDLAVLLARPGQPVHALELHTGQAPQTGADEVLDDRAKGEYRRRLTELDADIDEADAHQDPYRAEKARRERDALIDELASATGIRGGSRRLGDEGERARKAVTARIRDAIDRVGRANPALADHLRDAVRTGLWCTYAPAERIRWRQ